MVGAQKQQHHVNINTKTKHILWMIIPNTGTSHSNGSCLLTDVFVQRGSNSLIIGFWMIIPNISGYVSDIPFPRTFLPTAKKILTRLFRVFVHVYIHHFDTLVSIGAVSDVTSQYHPQFLHFNDGSFFYEWRCVM